MKAHTADYLQQLATRSQQEPVVAFFDLDRTLVDGYTLTALAWQQIFNGQMSLRRFISLSLMFAAYGLGRMRYEEMLQATVEDITGMTEEELTALGLQAYEQRLARWMYVEGAALVAEHQALGDDVVIVTSATAYQAAPVAQRLGIAHLCCTELEIVNGRVAGGVTPCYGAGKLTAARRYMERRQADLGQAYFYSDSPEDLPLLESVGYPVVVNGKSSLVKLAAARGWPSLQFEDKGGMQTA